MRHCRLLAPIQAFFVAGPGSKAAQGTLAQVGALASTMSPANRQLDMPHAVHACLAQATPGASRILTLTPSWQNRPERACVYMSCNS